MDAGALSIVMTQSKVQQSVGIAVVKMAMDNDAFVLNKINIP